MDIPPGASTLKRFGYREAGPHLMLMAFFNGGGRIEREYGLGSRALDLMIHWRGARHGIEVKLRRDTETETDALEQVAGYLDIAGLASGFLVTLHDRIATLLKVKLDEIDTALRFSPGLKA